MEECCLLWMVLKGEIGEDAVGIQDGGYQGNLYDMRSGAAFVDTRLRQEASA